MAAERQLRVDPRFDRAQAQLLQPLELDPRAAVELDVGERAPAPQAFGFAQALAASCGSPVARPASSSASNRSRVELAGLDPQPIAGRLA